MCFKSAIILKDRVFVPDYDSHTDMLEELGIEEKNAENLLVRAELIPLNNDMFSDISTWNFKTDQNIIPDWFVEEVDKQRMIEAVKAWAAEHIFVGKNNFEIKSGVAYLQNCKGVTAWNNSTVTAWDNSTVTYQRDDFKLVHVSEEGEQE